jgi:hypothetical protein
MLQQNFTSDFHLMVQVLELTSAFEERFHLRRQLFLGTRSSSSKAPFVVESQHSGSHKQQILNLFFGLQFKGTAIIFNHAAAV